MGACVERWCVRVSSGGFQPSELVLSWAYCALILSSTEIGEPDKLEK